MIKDQTEKYWDESTWIEMVIPITPGIGDEIGIPFIEQFGRNYQGYAHSERHKITGTTLEVYLEVHPFHDFYYKWIKMRDNYGKMKSWFASLPNG